MDPLMQRLLIAQEFSQTLLNLLALPVHPGRARVQEAIDACNAKLLAIPAEAPQPPLTAPQLAPKATT